ncbi:hypothetical protein Aduo_015606 [Ancylostoma duodenale]
MKHGGGSCLVWGCFSAHGMGPIHHIKGIIDRKAYLDILEKVMLPHARRALGQGFIFQEDNDSKHRSSDVQQWFRRRRITRLDWPSQSLDLNIIEPLWNELKERLAGKQARNVDEKLLRSRKSGATFHKPQSIGLLSPCLADVRL